MNTLVHTPLFAAVYFGFITLLAFQVSLVRMRKRISVGDGDDRTMRGAIRAHANALEHMIPFFLLLAFFEWQGGAKNHVLWIGWTFFACRISHAIGMTYHRFRMRRVGAGLTYLFEIGLAIMLLVQYFSGNAA